MDIKERLQGDTSKKFDECVEKHFKKIKNCLWGMICYAYNEGKKDGDEEARSGNSDTFKNAYNFGMEDMLDVIRDCCLDTCYRPSAFSGYELKEAFGGSIPSDILKFEAKDIMEKAREIKEKKRNEKGLWIPQHTDMRGYTDCFICSKCSVPVTRTFAYYKNDYKYCPNCRSEMEI